MATRPIVTGIGHVGLYAPDPEALADFYREVLDLQIVAQSKLNAGGLRSSLFLSSQPEADDYQVAIFANPETRHTAFQVASLADLRTLHHRVIERDLPIRWALNHGVSLAFYFSDPASNLIKLYRPTGIAYPQPHGHPIDLSQSETALMQDVANLMAQFKLSKEGNSGLA